MCGTSVPSRLETSLAVVVATVAVRQLATGERADNATDRLPAHADERACVSVAEQAEDRATLSFQDSKLAIEPPRCRKFQHHDIG